MGVENIYNRLMTEIKNPYGAAGAMGNIEAESGLRANNLQNSVEKRLGMTDEEYTAAVDNGSYADFCTDRGGYGLCQWTSAGRKTGLLNFAKSKGVSIGDEDMQIEWLLHELRTSYKGVLSALKGAKNVKEASDVFMCKFERPANQSDANKAARAARGMKYYEMYAGKEKAMSNSSLVNYTKISPNRTSPRNHKIDTITIHCMACDLSVERCGAVFAKRTRMASSNYGVGSDGRVGLYVEEKDRSWCSSNKANDHRAITIEVACSPVAPYKVTDAAMAALIGLVADICRRNDIKQLLWNGDKSLIGQVDKQNMTVHRWFAKKACPGDYLYGKHGYIAAEVNKRLGVTAAQPEPVQRPSATGAYKVRITAGTLNVRAGAGTGYRITTTVKKGGIYTITAEQNGWGRLKSGAGWISLKYTEKL